MPVCASSSSVEWKFYKYGYDNQTSNLSSANALFARVVTAERYNNNYAVSGSQINVSGSSDSYVIIHYYRIVQLAGASSLKPYRIKCSQISASCGSFTPSSSNNVFFLNPYFLIGSSSDVYADTAIPFKSLYYDLYYDVTNEPCCLWLAVPVFYPISPSSYNFSVTYSFSSIYSSEYGTDISINQSIDKLDSDLVSSFNQQTETVTNGYDNSGMNASNDKLASSMSSFDDAEAQVTDQSVEYIDAVTFFDPTTHLQLMSCITYTSTFLQDLFVALGDWSILIMIALSLAFALMLIGWFKYRK